MVRRLLAVASIILGALSVNQNSMYAAQTAQDTLITSRSKDTVYVVIKNVEQNSLNSVSTDKATEDKKNNIGQYFQPDLVLKGKYELDTDNGKSRFSVRNTRVGLKGKVASSMSYRLQLELSDNGSFKVLDLYAKFTPVRGLDIIAGQGSVPIFNGYTTSPGSLMFSNRPFIGKYFTSSRDIGVNVSYKIKQKGFPIAVEAGIYNGDGINNPQWNSAPAFGGRLLFGSMKGFRATVKAMRMEKSQEKDYFFWGADARYKGKRWLLEAEVMERHNYFSKQSLFSSYVQSSYTFPCNGKSLTGIEPAVRWDAMGYDVKDHGFGVNRATVGVNFNMDMKPFKTIFRINYEQYFNKDGVVIPDFTAEEANHNKFSLEFMLLF